jgi:large exoprotein involved in heme utilization and adhesion
MPSRALIPCSGRWATGIGGDITIAADSILIDNGGVIRTGLYSDASGKAGNIEIDAGR